MPPKPWETRSKKPQADVSQMVQSNNMTEITKQIPAGAPLPEIQKSATNSSTLASSAFSSPYSSPFSSSLGGGFGGFGSSMYGGLGGMGGMGMYGMMGNQDPSSTLSQSLNALQSFGYLISMLGEIGKTLEGNVDGIHRFYQSSKNLCTRGKTFTKQTIFSFFDKIKQLFIRMITFVKQKILLIGNRDKNSAHKLMNITIRLLFIIFAISLYPVVKKALKLKK